MHTQRARQYRLLMEELFPAKFGKNARVRAGETHQGKVIRDAGNNIVRHKDGLSKREPGRWQTSDAGSKYPTMVDVYLYDLWLGLFRFTTFVGAFLVVLPWLVVIGVYRTDVLSWLAAAWGEGRVWLLWLLDRGGIAVGAL